MYQLFGGEVGSASEDLSLASPGSKDSQGTFLLEGRRAL